MTLQPSMKFQIYVFSKGKEGIKNGTNYQLQIHKTPETII